ncbi:MAG: hypothetical protein IJD81_03270 [Oscillospiraceae bacterium]|nr:hypothetical protein [Oscillospiraceae bacterium]
MTAEEVFDDLAHKYGDDFTWRMLPFTNKSFVRELHRELGEGHYFLNNPIYAVAKCDANDDVLYGCGREDEKDVYYVFHLTWQANNQAGYPKRKKLVGIDAVREYIENDYLSSR